MSHRQQKLEEIGRLLAKGLPDGPSANRAHLVKQRILTINRRPNALWSTWLKPAVGLATSIGLALLATGLWMWISPRNLTVSAKGVPIAQAIGHWQRTDAETSLPLQFESYGEILLRSHTSVRISNATTREVAMELAQGVLKVDIVPGGPIDWRIHAGPYEISVLGTAFAVSWDADHSLLDVEVNRGRVFVARLTEPSNGVFVNADNGVRALASRKKLTVYPLDSDEDQKTAISPPETVPDKNKEAPVTVEAKKDEQKKTNGDHLGHRSPKSPGSASLMAPVALYDRGDYSGAMELAHKTGLNQLTASLDATSLWKLANAARYVRQADTAILFLDAIRRRFPDSARASSAAYLKGKIHADFLGDAPGAYVWYSAYLKESPSGPLADEAMGRLMDICLMTGRKKEAMTHAKNYLERYDGGLFAEKAEAIVRQNDRQ